MPKGSGILYAAVILPFVPCLISRMQILRYKSVNYCETKNNLNIF